MSKPYSQPGEKGTDTNQASEDELDTILVELCKNTQTDYGYQKLVPSETAKSKQAIKSLIRTEKLKLLAEVREQTTIFKIKSHDEKGQPHLYEAGRGVPTEALDKLEAEL